MISGIKSISTTSLTEMRQQAFNQIDTNQDGSIDKSEIALLIQESSSNLVNSFSSNLDTNQDDLVGTIEFESGMVKLEQQMKQAGGTAGASGMSAPPPPPDKVFDTADTNKDGIVTKDELAAAIGQGGGNIDELFSQVDTDGDGSITRAEDDAFLAQMDARKEQMNTTDSSTNTGIGEDFQSQMLAALMEGLLSSPSSSTSLWA
jgi:Ca2+-binding EF-hand superfamily protein